MHQIMLFVIWVVGLTNLRAPNLLGGSELLPPSTVEVESNLSFLEIYRDKKVFFDPAYVVCRICDERPDIDFIATSPYCFFAEFVLKSNKSMQVQFESGEILYATDPERVQTGPHHPGFS